MEAPIVIIAEDPEPSYPTGLIEPEPHFEDANGDIEQVCGVFPDYDEALGEEMNYGLEMAWKGCAEEVCHQWWEFCLEDESTNECMDSETPAEYHVCVNESCMQGCFDHAMSYGGVWDIVAPLAQGNPEELCSHRAFWCQANWMACASDDQGVPYGDEWPEERLECQIECFSELPECLQFVDEWFGDEDEEEADQEDEAEDWNGWRGIEWEFDCELGDDEVCNDMYCNNSGWWCDANACEDFDDDCERSACIEGCRIGLGIECAQPWWDCRAQDDEE